MDILASGKFLGMDGVIYFVTFVNEIDSFSYKQNFNFKIMDFCSFIL